MPSLLRFFGLLLLSLVLAQCAHDGRQTKPGNEASTPPADERPEDVAEAAKQQIRATYGTLPMRFEANQGQFEAPVRFVTQGSGYTLFLTEDEAVLSLRRSASSEPPSAEGDDPATTLPGRPADAVVRMTLVGANANPTVSGQDQMITRSNYLVGERAAWRTNVPNYAKVHYDEVYDGIDLIYYGNQQRLEYDFVVQPGADPDVIMLDFDGLEARGEQAALRVADNGDLILAIDGGEIRQHKPYLYQEIDGARREIEGQYEVRAANRVGFSVGAYDDARPLVIDPILVYSTYLGGTGEDVPRAITVDGSGNAYVTGSTLSSDFPTVNAFDGTLNDGVNTLDEDVFVAQFNATGTALVYATYLGGTDQGESSQDNSRRRFGQRLREWCYGINGLPDGECRSEYPRWC